MWMYLTRLNCTLKNGQDCKLCYVFFTTIKKNSVDISALGRASWLLWAIIVWRQPHRIAEAAWWWQLILNGNLLCTTHCSKLLWGQYYSMPSEATHEPEDSAWMVTLAAKEMGLPLEGQVATEGKMSSLQINPSLGRKHSWWSLQPYPKSPGGLPVQSLWRVASSFSIHQRNMGRRHTYFRCSPTVSPGLSVSPCASQSVLAAPLRSSMPVCKRLSWGLCFRKMTPLLPKALYTHTLPPAKTYTPQPPHIEFRGWAQSETNSQVQDESTWTKVNQPSTASKTGGLCFF